MEFTRSSQASQIKFLLCHVSLLHFFHQRAVNDSVLEDFPTLIAVQVLPRVTDSPAKGMIGQLLSSIKSSGRSTLCVSKKSDVLFNETVKFCLFDMRKMSDLNRLLFNSHLLDFIFFYATFLHKWRKMSYCKAFWITQVKLCFKVTSCLQTHGFFMYFMQTDLFVKCFFPIGDTHKHYSPNESRFISS